MAPICQEARAFGAIFARNFMGNTRTARAADELALSGRRPVACPARCEPALLKIVHVASPKTTTRLIALGRPMRHQSHIKATSKRQQSVLIARG
jgi:hypothetical protein